MSIRTQLRKVLPSISITEQEALDAGDVWLEGSIYQGKPDFVALRDVTAATLTSEEQAFLDGPVKTLMGMIDDSEIQNGKHLPDYILDFFKERAFLFSYYPEIIWRSRV
jgi:acyl-CoA dehydrogenase